MSSPQENVTHMPSSRDDGDDKPGLPDAEQYLRPAFWFRWIVEYLEAWIFSRNYRRLLAGLPFLVVAVGGSAYIWWLRGAPKDDIIDRLRTGGCHSHA